MVIWVVPLQSCCRKVTEKANSESRRALQLGSLVPMAYATQIALRC